MGKEILLSKSFPLPARAITESIAIIGRKGSGKTYTGGRLFEQMFEAGAQCIALDPVGNWYGLRLSASGKRKGLDIVIFGGEHGDIPITPEGGKLLAETIVERRLSCVIDLKLFRKNQRKKFVTDFAEELYFLKSKHRSPCHLFLEEARKFIPQKPMSPDENRMIGAFEDIVRLGRNYGLGASLLDQRPQSVNKEVLSQTEILMVHQLTGTHERKVIKEWVQDKATEGTAQLSQLTELQPGECFFWSPGLLRTFAKVKVGKKSTYDASATPELGGEENRLPPRPLSEGELAALQEAMAAVVEKAAQEDPKRLRTMLSNALKSVKHLESEVERLQLESRPAAPLRIEVPVVNEEALRGIETELLGLESHVAAKAAYLRERLAELCQIPKSSKPKTFFLNEQHTTTKSANSKSPRSWGNGFPSQG